MLEIFNICRAHPAPETLSVGHSEGRSVLAISSSSASERADHTRCLGGVWTDLTFSVTLAVSISARPGLTEDLFFVDVLRGGRRQENCRYRECAQCLENQDCTGYNQVIKHSNLCSFISYNLSTAPTTTASQGLKLEPATLESNKMFYINHLCSYIVILLYR